MYPLIFGELGFWSTSLPYIKIPLVPHSFVYPALLGKIFQGKGVMFLSDYTSDVCWSRKYPCQHQGWSLEIPTSKGVGSQQLIWKFQGGGWHKPDNHPW